MNLGDRNRVYRGLEFRIRDKPEILTNIPRIENIHRLLPLMSQHYMDIIVIGI